MRNANAPAPIKLILTSLRVAAPARKSFRGELVASVLVTTVKGSSAGEGSAQSIVTVIFGFPQCV